MKATKPISEMSDDDVRAWAVALQVARRDFPDKFEGDSEAIMQLHDIEVEILRRNLYVVYPKL
jgi:hypothetical protein